MWMSIQDTSRFYEATDFTQIRNTEQRADWPTLQVSFLIHKSCLQDRDFISRIFGTYPSEVQMGKLYIMNEKFSGLKGYYPDY